MYLAKFQSKQAIKALKIKFRALDINNNGKITTEEILQALDEEGVNEEEKQLAIKRFQDLDKRHNHITFKVFCKHHYECT